MTTQRERDWLLPAGVMTGGLGLGLAALLLMPIAGYHHIPPYFSRFINWLDFMFTRLDLTVHAAAFSFLWAVAIMGTMVWLLAQRPSRERSAALAAYFALWSIFGTIGQYLLSSAGPIFYQRIGLGDRFAELGTSIPPVTGMLSGYLWNFHASHTLGVGAGISAMPSLHIATAAWVYLALRGQRSRLAPLAALFALYLWAMSVALGWHYAVDGIVGAGGAIGCLWASRAWLGRRQRSAQATIPELAAA